MAAQAWPAQGVTLSIEEVNANTYSLIGNVVSLENMGGGTVAQAKTTWLNSTVHTYRPTIPDNAEVKASILFDPTDAVHKYLRNLKDGPATVSWQASFNTGSTNSSATFNGAVSEFSGPTADDVEGLLTADLTVKISGAVTWVNAN